MANGEPSVRKQNQSMTRTETAVINAERDFLTPTQFDSVVKAIGSTSWDKNFDMRIWDKMSEAQRDLALMEAGFTGLISEDDYEMGNLYYPMEKSELMGWMTEALANIAEGYGMDDTQTYYVGYKDGSVKTLSQDDNEFEMNTTARQSFRTKEGIAKKALRSSEIDFILYSDGYNQPRYYVNGERGLNALKKYGGFEEWKNGRGEKRRNYVQDDWI